jgi:hypothetical protein
MDIYIYIYIYEYICAVCRVDVKYAPFKVTIVSRYRVGGYSHVNIYRYIYIYIYISIIPDTWPSLFSLIRGREGGVNLNIYVLQRLTWLCAKHTFKRLPSTHLEPSR